MRILFSSLAPKIPGAYAAALALRRVGHHVLVLEQRNDGPLLAGSSRIPPNMSKILFGWGLEEECRSMAIVSRFVAMSNYLTGEVWGEHQWDEEILKETRGVFLLMHQTDVRDLLKKTAIALGAVVRRNATIVGFDLEDEDNLPGVLLADGETLRANVIIGADGRPSMVRELAFAVQDPRKACHLVVFDVTVPISEMLKDPELTEFLGDSVMLCICGDRHAVLSNPVGGLPEYSMHIIVPNDGSFHPSSREWIKEVSASQILQAMGPCDSRLVKLINMSHSRICAKMLKQFEVEDWVHPDANAVLIGGAAHPFHAGAVYSRSMAVEDAACLAELFSHLSHLDQISDFLNAFQEIRQPRCTEIRQMEEVIMHTMTMSDEEAEARDAHMKEAVDDGKGIMSYLGFDQLVAMFAYEAEDAANNWWVTWGVVKERMRNDRKRSLYGFAFVAT
ncbi:hypothetical protein SCP_1503080 [Sparassis crispa]|uniref:FAD-binding domain-containing protein n=1 Tax=Sparassis crispa TaxID=139825 RepID=A0A401H4M0_9APHY|nr:hypothetical protein SCP_1503080 [Sparassis crispa]GBE89300.1 hypothetical protein SCP_1503080 [Sparassis crispa]